MRKIIITFSFSLFSFFSFAQNKDTTYSHAWLEIDTLIIKKGLVKTALSKVAEIEKKARLYQQDAQFLKCLIYRYSLEPSISEKTINDYIGTIKKDIEVSKNNVAKSILHTLMAKQLEKYLDERRWELYNRNNTIKLNSSDITTWALNDFVRSISSAYQTALTFSSDLQQMPIDRYDAILLKGNNTGLRSIYDLLLSEAIQYFKKGEKYNTQPIQSFVLKAPELFNLGEEFIAQPIATPDSNNHQWITLDLYKKLLSEHIKDNDKNFWIEKEIERLEWLLEYSSQKEKIKNYENGLQSLAARWPNEPAITHAWYLIAKKAYDKGLNYKPFTDTVHRYAFTKTKQIAEQALARFKSVQNFGTTSLKNLLADIHQQQLKVLTEIVNLPEKPFRALVEYKNINHLYGRIIQVNSSNIEVIRSHASNEYDWEDILQLKPYKKFDITLPATDDYQLHKTEIKIDALPLGQYAIVCSDKNDFVDTNSLSFQRVYVSKISYIKNGGDYFVVDRETGQPMPGVKASLKEEVYNTKTKKESFREVAKRITDTNGYFSLKGVEERGIHLDFQAGKDQLFIEKENYWHNSYEQNIVPIVDEARTKRIFFFTDRNIYRPGQIVFFKGIAVSKPNGSVEDKIRPAGDSVWVYLFNVNHKKTDSLKCIVNGYGSFSGKFTLPQNTLTGSFSIQTPAFNYSGSSFSVEEYKRPTFSVTLDDIKTVYKLNDSIEVRGQAKALSGSSINDAKVVFQVKRKSWFNMPSFWRGSNQHEGQQEIANGIIRTDAEGKFSLHFKALPAEDMAPENNPIFTFDIQLSVTDNNGETRTGDKEISIGYQSLLLTINAPSVSEVNHLKKIQIGVTNTNQEKAEAIVIAKLIKLQSPSRLIRKRLWDKPDQFTMTEKEFIALFPNDEYKEETAAHTWQKEKIVLTQTINTKESDILEIGNLSLEAGYYKIEISTKDKDSIPVMQEHIFLLTDQVTQNLGFLSYQLLLEQKTTIEPGDTASFLHGFSFNKVHIIQKTEKPNQKASYQFQNRNKGFTNNRFTATEADRGGIFVTGAYVIHNRVYTYEQRINVPWTNKQLEINYKSFRNKTEPGSKELWSVNITPPKNADKNGIELLTAMYDASLDVFKSTNWSKPAIWPTLNVYNQFDHSSGFEIGEPIINELEINYLPYLDITYDQIAREAYELCIANLSLWRKDSSVSITYFTPSKIVADEKVLRGGLNEVIRHESEKDTFIQTLQGRTAGIAVTRNKNMAAAASIRIRGANSVNTANAPLYVVDGIIVSNIESISPDLLATAVVLKSEEATALYGSRAAGGVIIISTNKQTSTPVTIRKNFNETAFFFPHLYADTAGNYSFSFTMPDALTKWKWMSLAHTKDLAFGINSTNIITQKTLMVQANAPRFIREGDKIEFSAKISNLSEKELSGQVTLELIDAATGNSVDGWFQNVFPVQYFTAPGGQSTVIKFPIQVPFSFNKTLSWRFVARSANYSDGEENMLPVLTNRQLVTENLPIFIKKDTTQTFRFEKLLQAISPSLTHEAITINYTANPIWEAIRALPYLMEYPYECVEQTFNRFYANALGSYIVNKDPKIKKVFDAWAKDTTAQKSKLQLNESLKQIMLEETPWVMAGQSEEQQQKNLALLFDVFRLNQQSEQLVQKLQEMQLTDGSFSWFKGGYSDRYMTNYVLTGLGKLKRIGALNPDIAIRLKSLTDNAIQFMDEELNKEYQSWKKTKLDTTRTLISNMHIQYLFMRSFYRDMTPSKYREAYQFFYERGKYQIQKQSIYNRALLGLVYYRNNEIRYVNVNIRAAILENAVRDIEKSARYWKDRQSYSWYSTPVEHQSTIIQFLQELQQQQPQHEGNQSIDEARNWLLLNKQTHHWKTTIATAEACYALLMTGNDLLHADKNVRIQLGKNSYSSHEQKTEAGTGYFQQRIEGRLVEPEMGNIKVTVQTAGASKIQSPSWGSIYWQYFEDMDKITKSATPLSITKQLFIERNSKNGKVLEAIKENEALKPGDKVIIRLTLKSDREMEYLHLKDTRASTMEPVNVLSGYKWQDGLGYYESTKDASTNFFISQLRKGTYVFDYPVFITHIGEFSTGNASIQCMYAPEFTANSGGMKIRVEE